jgi:hypothetical protein
MANTKSPLATFPLSNKENGALSIPCRNGFLREKRKHLTPRGISHDSLNPQAEDGDIKMIF